MKYEDPNMMIIRLEREDVITLSVGSDDYNPTIDSETGNNPWAY